MNKQSIDTYEANFKAKVEAFINYERSQQSKSPLIFKYSKYLKVSAEFRMGLRVIVMDGLSHIATYNAEESEQAEMFYSSRSFGLNAYDSIAEQLWSI